jgi:hypothetical protein
MTHRLCQVRIGIDGAPATMPECGRPAKAKLCGCWMCVVHYDEFLPSFAEFGIDLVKCARDQRRVYGQPGMTSVPPLAALW